MDAVKMELGLELSVKEEVEVLKNCRSKTPQELSRDFNRILSKIVELAKKEHRRLYYLYHPLPSGVKIINPAEYPPPSTTQTVDVNPPIPGMDQFETFAGAFFHFVAHLLTVVYLSGNWDKNYAFPAFDFSAKDQKDTLEVL